MLLATDHIPSRYTSSMKFELQLVIHSGLVADREWLIGIVKKIILGKLVYEMLLEDSEK